MVRKDLSLVAKAALELLILLHLLLSDGVASMYHHAQLENLFLVHELCQQSAHSRTPLG